MPELLRWSPSPSPSPSVLQALETVPKYARPNGAPIRSDDVSNDSAGRFVVYRAARQLKSGPTSFDNEEWAGTLQEASKEKARQVALCPTAEPLIFSGG